MLLRIYHETEFQYAGPVCDSYVEARLRPWSDADQGCADFILTSTPAARLFTLRTPFAWVDYFNVLAPHAVLRLVSEATVITMPRNPFERIDLSQEDWPLLRSDDLRSQFWEYLQPPDEPEVADQTRQRGDDLRRQAGTRAVEFLLALTRSIHAEYAYDPRATNVATPLAEVLAQRRGVCQDFAHLMIAVARSAGIPARYVSGYLHVENPPEGDGAMHAWVEAFLPHTGWIGFDPTHGLLVDHQYVKVGVGRSYRDVPPTRGVFRGPQEHDIRVRVRITSEETAFGRSGVQAPGRLSLDRINRIDGMGRALLQPNPNPVDPSSAARVRDPVQERA